MENASFDDKISHLYDSRSSYSAATTPSDNSVELESGQLGAEFWKTKYDQLEEHCKVINEQKVTITSRGTGSHHFWRR